jgi:hypothetical protein
LPDVAARSLMLGIVLMQLSCGGGERSSGSGGSARRDAAAIAAQAAERNAWLAAASAKSGSRPSCPADGRWAPCSVFDRLDRAGLAPRVDSSMARDPGLEQDGTVLRVGSGELRIYLYPDSSARRADESHLEKGRYIEATGQPTMRNDATVIRSNNLLAVLRTRNETQRERVALVFGAGPPQPR